jgi:hypothetical protein
MKKLFVFCSGAIVLLLFGCNKASVPVNKIEFNPGFAKLFIGEEQAFTVNCFPSNATNLGDMVITNSDPSVATFENGKLVAKAGGYTTLVAICGEVKGKADVTVYSGWFTKGGIKYGVDSASGWYFTMGESTPQEMEMTLTHMVPNSEDTQNFWFWMKCENLGTTIDFMQDMKESQVSVQMNNNEDGYCVAYYSEELGRPVVKLADWGDTDVTLTKGLLTVTKTGSASFSISADFALSNGYTFKAEWEGAPIMQQE